MDITIGFLVVLMKMNGLADNAGVAAVMAVLAIISLILLLLFFKKR
jgi:Na+/melibiose symporter-like transporter